MPTAKKTTKKPTKKETIKEVVKETCCKEEVKKNLFKHHGKDSGMWTIYFLWFVWAAIYFIWQATSFWIWVLAFLKAIIRPVFLVHGLLKFLWL